MYSIRDERSASQDCRTEAEFRHTVVEPRVNEGDIQCGGAGAASPSSAF